jgi:hypothetical protein
MNRRVIDGLQRLAVSIFQRLRLRPPGPRHRAGELRAVQGVRGLPLPLGHARCGTPPCCLRVLTIMSYMNCGMVQLS